MKKVFKLIDPKKAPARQVDYVKHEIRKYIARERRRALPERADYWDFDCAIGVDQNTTNKIHIDDVNKNIDAIVALEAESFYIEVLVKEGYRNKKDN